MPLGTNQVTITTASNFIPQIWGPAVIRATEANLVLRDLCWDWSEGGQEKGNQINIPNLSNQSASVKAANTQVTLVATTEASTALIINRHDEVSFLIEDFAKVQASWNLSQMFTEKAGYGIGRQLDTRIVNLIPSLTQIVGSAGTDLGDTDIRSAIELLDVGDVPPEDRHFVVYPTQKNAIWGIEKYFRADMTGNGVSPVVNGKFGQIYGIKTYVSTNLSTSGTPAARLNVMFHRQAFASVIQMGPRVQSDYIIEYIGDIVVNDVVSGEVLARNSFGVWLRS